MKIGWYLDVFLLFNNFLKLKFDGTDVWHMANFWTDDVTMESYSAIKSRDIGLSKNLSLVAVG